MSLTTDGTQLTMPVMPAGSYGGNGGNGGWGENGPTQEKPKADDPHERAKATRKRNEEMQRQRWAAEREAMEAARTGLLRVMNDPNATNGDILKAAELLVQITKRY